jgi:hypothetical protein
LTLLLRAPIITGLFAHPAAAYGSGGSAC